MTSVAETDDYDWPHDLLSAASVRDWIAYALPRRPHVTGPLRIFQAKEWGVTALFNAATPGPSGTTRDVVFKANHLSLFRDAPAVESLLSRHCPGLAPEVLAWQRVPSGSWTLYSAFTGVIVSALESIEPLLGMVRSLAAIQRTVAALPASELSELPRVPLNAFPAIFETVLADIRARHLAFWRGEGRDLADQFSLRDDVADQMEAVRPQIPRWVAELESGGWPPSLDHVDLQASNAVVQPNGTVLLYDWEEANLSCPFFSLDLLLDDARDLAGDEGERNLRTAYLDALPWSARAARDRALDLALCLSPLKHAYEALRLADALGWTEGAPHIAAWALGRALPRWRAISSARRRRNPC